MRKIAVVPASSGNLGPGFDVLGLALSLYNEVAIEVSSDRMSVDIEGEGAESLPRDETNLTVQAAKKVFGICLSKRQANRLLASCRFRLIHRIPIARGLGSSAAAIVGGMAAANALCGGRLKKEEIFRLAAQLEGHADNVGPVCFGGFCAALFEENQFQFLSLPIHGNIAAAVAVPSFELKTKKARSALPRRVTLEQAVRNLGRTAFLIGSLSHQHPSLLRWAMKDELHQPYRQQLVPGMLLAFDRALRAGAWGAALSGAGPSILALSANRVLAAKVGEAMVRAFKTCGVVSRFLVLSIDRRGVRVY